jgi:hypothetical protein
MKMRRLAGAIAARLAGHRKKSQEIIKSISRANQASGKVFRGGFWHPDSIQTL